MRLQIWQSFAKLMKKEPDEETRGSPGIRHRPGFPKGMRAGGRIGTICRNGAGKTEADALAGGGGEKARAGAFWLF